MTAFQPEIEVIDDLPVLSWLVDLRDAGRVLLGSKVEVLRLPSGVHVFEGAWDGEFDSCGFADSSNFFGSGFVLDDGGATFSTSSDTLESLYLVQDDRGALVSNSLSFLVSYAGLRLRADRKTFRKLMSIMEGVYEYDKVLYEADGTKIERFVYCNVRISGKDVEKIEKKEPPHFQSYEEYRNYIVQTLRKLVENAASPNRKTQHKLLTTVSSGYDSAACAALASVIGGELALTIRTSRAGLPDSGKPVADVLGLDCIEAERENPDTFGEFAEAEFIVGGSGGDCSLLAFEPHLPGSILLTGFHGGKVWDIQQKPAPGISSKDNSGSGLYEFRRRTNFIHVPVPFIAAIRDPDLHKIAHSPEMQPYHLGNNYDRPLARRLVEEQGVPRQIFGQKKKASGFMLTTEEAALPEKTRRAVDRFAIERYGFAFLFLEWLHRVPRDLLNVVWRFMTWLLSKGTERAKNTPGRFMLKACRYLSLRINTVYGNLWPFDRDNDLLFVWALERTGTRYRKAGCKSISRHN